MNENFQMTSEVTFDNSELLIISLISNENTQKLYTIG